MLLATHDGAAFLDEQLDSILAQQGVAVTVFVSDDGSTDGTATMLEQRAASDARLVLLPAGRFGSSWANFYRLLRDVDGDGFDAVAMSDQDDVWMPGRLATQVAALADADAVSSDVEAFDEHGRRRLIRKSQPLRALDHVFESAGPGSTFVLSPAAVGLVRDVLDADPVASTVEAHDWLVYAVVRSAGMRWRILDQSLVAYRQHGANVLGANVGVRARIDRSGRILRGWYREQVGRVAEVSARVAAPAERAELETLARAVRGSRIDRMRLATRAGAFRRRRRDAVALGLLMAVGAF
ncbi:MULTISPECIES: glycosyltransferase [unclassified Agrococcus]|uniref:glycosyltransferase n=1 Tax=unclassified Agrococcus TaxID=2615065 RepID=UPI00360A36D7